MEKWRPSELYDLSLRRSAWKCHELPQAGLTYFKSPQFNNWRGRKREYRIDLLSILQESTLQSGLTYFLQLGANVIEKIKHLYLIIRSSNIINYNHHIYIDHRCSHHLFVPHHRVDTHSSNFRDGMHVCVPVGRFQ